jgi:hypothetical protein
MISRPISEVTTVLGEHAAPDECIPADRPGQVALLVDSGLFGEVNLAEMTDAQVLLAAFIVAAMPLKSARQKRFVHDRDEEHDKHTEIALVLSVTFGKDARVTIIVLPCDEAGIERLQLRSVPS